MDALLESLDWSHVYVAAGLWNIATGGAYLLLSRSIARRYGIGGDSEGVSSDRVLANLLHIYFGVLAFWIADDPARDAHLIALWISAKMTSTVLALVRHARTDPDRRRLVTLGPAATDVVWSALFLASLLDLSSGPTPS